MSRPRSMPPQTSDRPVLIACRTTIGYRRADRAGTAKAHGEAPGAEEVAGARKNLDWPYEPFVMPDDISVGLAQDRRARRPRPRAAWNSAQGRKPTRPRADSRPRWPATCRASLAKAIAAHKKKLSAEDKPAIATRKASRGRARSHQCGDAEITIGGSADLTGSNNTLTKGMEAVAPGDYAGRYIHYGIREHGMAAAMNGMALHGGVMPYSRHLPGLLRLCAARRSGWPR